jgi:hypothetical protein
MALGVGAGAVVARARAVVEADTRPLDKGLDRAEKRSKQAFGAIAKAATIGLVAVAAFAFKATQAASDLGEQVNKTNVIFGKSKKDVLEWSEGSAKAMGLSRRAALEYAGTLGSMLRPMGFTDRASAGMSKRLVQLTSDLASFNNANPEEVFTAIKSGVSGESEPLRRFGVILNQDRINLEAVSKGLVKANVDMGKVRDAETKVELARGKLAEATKKHGKGSAEAKQAELALHSAIEGSSKALAGKMPKLTAAQKAAAIYSIILKDTTLAQGDFGRTSDGLANQQRILNAEWEDARAKLGQSFLPAATKLAGLLSKLVGFTSEHSTATKILLGVLTLLAAVIVVVNTGFAIYNSRIVTAMKGTKAAAAAQWLLNAALSANPIMIAVLAVAALVTGIVILWKKSETFRNVTKAVWSAVSGAVKTAVDLVLRYVGFWLSMLEKVLRAASHIPFIGDKFKKAADGVQKAKDKVDELRDSITKTKGKKVDVDVNFTFNGRSIGGRGQGAPGGQDGAIGAAFNNMINRGAQNTVATAGPAGASPRRDVNPALWDEIAIGELSGLTVSSTHRAGAITSTGNPSLHGVYPAQAVDMTDGTNLGWNSPRMRMAFHSIAGRPGVDEVILSPYWWHPGSGLTRISSPSVMRGHWDHIHVGDRVGGGDGIVGRFGDGLATTTRRIGGTMSLTRFAGDGTKGRKKKKLTPAQRRARKQAKFDRIQKGSDRRLARSERRESVFSSAATRRQRRRERDGTTTPAEINARIKDIRHEIGILEGRRRGLLADASKAARGGLPGLARTLREKAQDVGSQIADLKEDIADLEHQKADQAAQASAPSSDLPDEIEEEIFDAEGTTERVDDDILAYEHAKAFLEEQLAHADTPGERLPIKRALRDVNAKIAELGGQGDRQRDSYAGAQVSLERQFGSNIFGTSTGGGDGTRGGGGGEQPAGQGGPAPGKTVNVHMNFNKPPDDPHPLLRSARFAAEGIFG